MKKLLFASATALAMIAAPAAAQVEREAPIGSTNSVQDKRTFTTDQEAIYNDLSVEYRTHFDRLAPERQTLYFGWDAALRDYYWTLDDHQRDMWWTLSEIDRIKLFQREIAWSSVMGDTPSYSNEPQVVAYTTGPTVISYRSNPVVQDVDMTRPANYPICKSDADDSCMNAWAAGLRGPGVDRPLSYYPEQDTEKGG